jgi:hypothetical protein
MLEDRRMLAFVIVPTWDPSISSLPDAAAVEATINTAIQNYESYFSNNVTVNILFKDSKTGLGGNTFGTFFAVSYTTYLAHLHADETANNPFLAQALSTLPSGPNNPVDGNPEIDLRTAEARMLGFNAPPTIASGLSSPAMVDSVLSLNLSIINVNRPGAVSTDYDLLDVVTHEMDEVLGFGSIMDGNLHDGDPAPTGAVEPDDLYRFSSAGVRTLNTNPSTTAFYSIDGGNTDLAQFNQFNTAANSDDFGDWFSQGPHSLQVQDAENTEEQTTTMGAEMIRLEALGYTPKNLAIPVLSSTGVLTIDGDNTDDIRIDPNNSAILQVFENEGQVLGNAVFVPTAVYPVAWVKQIDVNTAGNGATLFLDFTGGDPSPSGGIHYNGGGGANNGLVLFSGTALTEVETPTSATAGTIQFGNDPAISYSNTATIDDTVQVTKTATFEGVGSDTLALTNGPTVDALQTTMLQSIGGDFATVNFAYKANVVVNTNGGNNIVNVDFTDTPTNVDTFAVDGGGANDTVNVRAIATNLTIDGGGGFNTVNFGSLAPTSPGGNLSGLAANVAVVDTAGMTQLNVDDSGDSTARPGAELANLPISGKTFGSLSGVGGDGGISYELAITSALSINGSGGGTALTVDFSNGSPVPSGGLTFNGSTGGVANTLSLENGSFTSEVETPTSGTAGAIQFAQGAPVGLISYTNVKTVDDTATVTGTATFEGAGSDTIGLTNGPTVNSVPTIMLHSVGGDFANINFANKTKTVVDTNGGNNIVNVNVATAPAGVQSVEVDGGGGNETVNFRPSPLP